MSIIPQKTFINNNNENENIILMLNKIINNQKTLLEKMEKIENELDKLKGM